MPLSISPHRVFRRFTQVTPTLLREMGIHLLLCDLDNTLAPPRTRHPTEEVRQWIAALGEAGVGFAIVSNNRSSDRVEAYCRELGVPYFGHAGKPKPAGFRRAMALFGEAPDHTAMLGDLWTTDFLGANLAGLTVLAVEPVEGAPDIGHWILYQLHRPWMAAARRRQKPHGKI